MVELYRDNTGRIIGCYSVGDAPKGEWASLFERPFSSKIITRQQYWDFKTDKINIEGFHWPIPRT